MFFSKRKGTVRSRRFRGLITLVATMTLVMVMALPSYADTHVIELPNEGLLDEDEVGDPYVLHHEDTPPELVGQTCSVTASGQNNSSVYPGNNIEIASGSTVTLVGVEDFEDKTTVAEGVLTLADTITVTLFFGPEGDYSAQLSIHLNCEVATTTTEAPTTTTTTSGGGAGGSEETLPTPTEPDDDVVGGIEITTTSAGEGVEDTEIGESEVTEPDVLPFTGSNDGALLLLAGSALALGGILLVGSRREES